VLNGWHAAMAFDDAWLLIQRNYDRECDRSDIEEDPFNAFLREVASRYISSSNPIDVIDEIFEKRRSSFVLSGRPLPLRTAPLSRIMSLEGFVKYHLYPTGTWIPVDLATVASHLTTGMLTGHDLVNSTVGRSDYPTWVTRSGDIPAPATAEDLRNLLGLKHIQHGHLVEMQYPDMPSAGGCGMTRAPTVLDAAANEADNWIFAKRAGVGGPEWGHAVDLAASRAGLPEAVHREFYVNPARAASISLRYVGHVPCSAPSVNFGNLRTST
jgi:hypothetical protein